MNRSGARGSPWRTPALMLKLVVSPSGVNTTADVFTYIICMAYDFLEVDENNGSFFLVVSHFFDDASKGKKMSVSMLGSVS